MAASRKSSVMLKAVKKITVQFCPFESNVRSTREFLALVGWEKARSCFYFLFFNSSTFVSSVLRRLSQLQRRQNAASCQLIGPASAF
uniref:Mitochondrial ribosomal protein L53 n=1 Tax=Salarias fasciatus TaxID=181472 RepID=A0A672HS81_SALFA